MTGGNEKMSPTEKSQAQSAKVKVTFGQKCRSLASKVLASGPSTPLRISASVGLGICMGIVPIWGYQMLVAALLAHLLRLNKFIAVLASNISIPIMIPVILYASLLSGRLVLSGEMDYSLALSDMNLSMAWGMLSEYLVGSLVLAVVAGLTGGGLTYLIIRCCLFFRARRSQS